MWFDSFCDSKGKSSSRPPNAHLQQRVLLQNERTMGTGQELGKIPHGKGCPGWHSCPGQGWSPGGAQGWLGQAVEHPGTVGGAPEGPFQHEPFQIYFLFYSSELALIQLGQLFGINRITPTELPPLSELSHTRAERAGVPENSHQERISQTE